MLTVLWKDGTDVVTEAQKRATRSVSYAIKHSLHSPTLTYPLLLLLGLCKSFLRDSAFPYCHKIILTLLQRHSTPDMLQVQICLSHSSIYAWLQYGGCFEDGTQRTSH